MNHSPYQNVVLCIFQVAYAIYCLNKYKTTIGVKNRQNLIFAAIFFALAAYNFWKLSPDQLIK